MWNDALRSSARLRLLAVAAFCALLPSALLHGAAAPPAGSAIGARPDNLMFRDLKGGGHTLLGREALPAVYLFLGTQCPVANAYTTRILALEKHCRAQGVHLVGVYPNEIDSATD